MHMQGLGKPKNVDHGTCVHSVAQRASAGGVAAVPVDMNGMLLRGTTLKNSGRIVGLVVYTGKESRIQMNAAPPPRKRGAPTGSTVLLVGFGGQRRLVARLICVA